MLKINLYLKFSWWLFILFLVAVLSSNFSFSIQDDFLFSSIFLCFEKRFFFCPATLTYISIVDDRLDGNPNLFNKSSWEDEEEEDKEKTNNNVIVPVVASIISVLVLLLGEVAALWIFKRRQQHGILLCLMGYFKKKLVTTLITFTMI